MHFSIRPLFTVLALGCGLALAQNLPATVDAALLQAKLPRDAVTFLVIDAQGKTPARLSHRANVPVNPASVMKLVTTYAALELLGPAYSWRTPVWVQGTVRDGTLDGNLYIKGQGDPKLVTERLWLLLRRVQSMGVHTIAGDIVLDRSAFESVESDPASFDGEPFKPYNATPDALLVNFKSVVMTFTPNAASNSAQLQFEPPLAGVQMQASVPLSNGDCADYRASLKADFADPGRIRFLGTYPASCGEKVWSVAYAEPKSFAARAVEGLWREMGGKLNGTVHEGKAPGSASSFEVSSPTLAEIIRDINKYSNNVMAQQLFLSLSLPGRDGSSTTGAAVAASGPATSGEASREVVRRWWKERISADDLPLLDNGSGLSRQERISAQALGRLLQTAYASGLMPELMSSLPIAGVDGTLKNRRIPVGAHLKTGSLRDVAAVAGYVDGASGKRYCLVAIANHANASAARAVFDALIDWVAKDN